MGKVVVSAQLLLVVDGRTLSEATGFSLQCVAKYAEEAQLDSEESAEFAPTVFGVAGEVQLVRTAGGGGAQGAGLVLPPPYFVRKKYSSMVMRDRLTGLPIFEFEGEVVFEGERWQTAARGAMTGSVSYRAVKYGNEATGQVGV